MSASDYVDLVIRADDEATATALAEAVGVQSGGLLEPYADGAWVTSGHNHSLLHLGEVVLTPAVLDEDGDVTTPAVMSGDFRVMVRLANTHAPAAAQILGALFAGAFAGQGEYATNGSIYTGVRWAS